MVATGDNIVNTGATVYTSAAHTYGNVMGLVEMYLLDLFPADLFKNVMASTKVAHRQITHTPSRLMKKEFPMMVLSPRIVFGQDERFLGHTLFNDRRTNTQATWGDGSLIELGVDKRKSLWLHGHYNRMVVYIDVVMTFNTYTEQINYMHYMHNMIPINHNHFIQAPLEINIPKSYCKMISELIGVPIYDDTGSVSTFLTHMNTLWGHPITYKLKGGNNQDEFFMYYMADIDTKVETPTMNESSSEGQINKSYSIAFTTRCEFNSIGYLTINSPNLEKPVKLMDDSMSDGIIPIFTDNIKLGDFNLPIGWTILGWPIFKLDIGDPEISIDNILNDPLRALIDHHIRFSIPMEKLISVQFRENGNVLHQEAFTINWSTRTLRVMKPDYHRTYRLIITVADAYIKELYKELFNLE